VLKLRPFQIECVDKLLNEPSSIIGDDMGLGKTVEGIALDMARRDAAPRGKKRTLVIAPMSMLSSWEEHFTDWQPGLTTIVINPKNRDAFLLAVEKGSYDVYIMHWDVVRLLPDLAKYKWFHIIADEAHRVANREAQVTVRSKKIPRQFLTELSGTPMTTRPDQFWSLLNWLKPKVFTSYHRFYERHVVSIKHDNSGDCKGVFKNGQTCGKGHKVSFKQIIGVQNIDELLRTIQPYYVRRLKEDVLKDLPPKQFTRITVKLGPQQRKVYDQMRDEMLAWIGENEDQPLAAPMAIAKLVRLQQLACAYANVRWEKVRAINPDWPSGGIPEEKYDESLGIPKSSEPEKYHLVDKQIVTLMDPSSKLDACMEILNDNPDKQFVVFSQSKQVINLLAKRLEAAKISHGVFTGDTSPDNRTDIRTAFQAGHLRVFAGTIQAGGEGITLTAASTVIFLDRAWSPAKNRQAEDRCHRIGQKDSVQIIDIVAVNTIDAGRLQRIETNWQFIKQLLGDKDAKTKPEGAYV
jgi:SNF2 family DNA or RNA helicase